MAGASPAIWMIFAGALVLVLFVWWENRRVKRGDGALIDPAMLRNLQLRSGVMSFLFMFLIQAGIFFTVPLFLSVALGILVVETGAAASAVAVAAPVRRRRPEAAPQRVAPARHPARIHHAVRRPRAAGRVARRWRRSGDHHLAAAARRVRARDDGLPARRRDGPSVPDEKSGEVGGLQNPHPAGASIRTALAGAVLISAMTASFFTGIENNPNVPDSVVSQAQTQLAGGVPFISEADAKAALQKANVPTATADEIVKQNEKSQIDGLRAAEAILALLALIALPFTRGIPTIQPGAQAKPRPSPA